jgi:hypothetical protein
MTLQWKAAPASVRSSYTSRVGGGGKGVSFSSPKAQEATLVKPAGLAGLSAPTASPAAAATEVKAAKQSKSALKTPSVAKAKPVQGKVKTVGQKRKAKQAVEEDEEEAEGQQEEGGAAAAPAADLAAAPAAAAPKVLMSIRMRAKKLYLASKMAGGETMDAATQEWTDATDETKATWFAEAQAEKDAAAAAAAAFPASGDDEEEEDVALPAATQAHGQEEPQQPAEEQEKEAELSDLE